MTWEDLGWTLATAARRLNAEWKMEWPQADTLPSEALEQVVDEQCAILCRDLQTKLAPPDLAKPWILVRLRYAAKICLAPVPQSGKEPPELDEKTLRQLLILVWRSLGRADWARGLKLDKE